ncbi:MAG: hypothetical protein ACC628_03395 [Pirellulaceae bacterium]
MRYWLMDPLHLAIALGPLSVYLVLLGVINLSKRPFITNGARDGAALGVAIGGLIVAGPMELFLPEATAFRVGAFVWVLLLAFYVLCLTLFVLLMRPRLVIYNIHRDEIRPLLATLVNELDRDAKWAGECLMLPNLGVQLQVETFAAMRVVQLVSAGPQQSYEGWQKLERALSQALRQTSRTRNPLGFSLVCCGMLLVALVTTCMIRDAATVAQSLKEMLRF